MAHINDTFQFTHPVRDVTNEETPTTAIACISIHTSRAGCDTLQRKV